MRSRAQASASSRRVEKAFRWLLFVAGDLEAGDASDHGLCRGVAQGLDPAFEFAAVEGADQQLRALQPDEVGAAPLSFGILRHVGDHRMGMKLRVEVAAGVMPEGRRHHAVGLHAGSTARCRIPGPCLEEFVLDEVERCLHRLVMGTDDLRTGLRCGMDERFERYRFRAEKVTSTPGRCSCLPSRMRPRRDFVPGMRPWRDLLEALRLDRAMEAERLDTPAVPAARLAMLGIILRVVAVRFEVVDGGRSFAEAGDSGDHQFSPEQGVMVPTVKVSAIPNPGGLISIRTFD